MRKLTLQTVIPLIKSEKCQSSTFGFFVASLKRLDAMNKMIDSLLFLFYGLELFVCFFFSKTVRYNGINYSINLEP